MPVDLLSIGASAVGSIYDSIFGSIDQGHWQGNEFIPGDLQTRYNEVEKLMKERGLGQGEVDYTQINTILKGTGVWQVAIQNYLDSVLNKKMNASKTIQSVANTQRVIDRAIPDVINQAGMLASNNFIYIAIIGAVIFFLLRKK